MMLMYNYKLETGVVGTNDENIASVLYNINRMEINKSLTSSDKNKLDEALGELFFMITDAKVHMNRFLKMFGDKTDTDTAGEVIAAFDGAMQIVRDVWEDDVETAVKATAFPTVYNRLLAIVPSVLALDGQATGSGD